MAPETHYLPNFKLFSCFLSGIEPGTKGRHSLGQPGRAVEMGVGLRTGWAGTGLETSILQCYRGRCSQRQPGLKWCPGPTWSPGTKGGSGAPRWGSLGLGGELPGGAPQGLVGRSQVGLIRAFNAHKSPGGGEAAPFALGCRLLCLWGLIPGRAVGRMQHPGCLSPVWAGVFVSPV